MEQNCRTYPINPGGFAYLQREMWGIKGRFIEDDGCSLFHPQELLDALSAILEGKEVVFENHPSDYHQISGESYRAIDRLLGAIHRHLVGLKYCTIDPQVVLNGFNAINAEEDLRCDLVDDTLYE